MTRGGVTSPSYVLWKGLVSGAGSCDTGVGGPRTGRDWGSCVCLRDEAGDGVGGGGRSWKWEQRTRSGQGLFTVRSTFWGLGTSRPGTLDRHGRRMYVRGTSVVRVSFRRVGTGLATRRPCVARGEGRARTRPLALEGGSPELRDRYGPFIPRRPRPRRQSGREGHQCLVRRPGSFFTRRRVPEGRDRRTLLCGEGTGGRNDRRICGLRSWTFSFVSYRRSRVRGLADG